MLDAGIIEIVEEYKWIILIVVQDKQTVGEVRICVDLIKLYHACLHNPFLTPFTDEILESIELQEFYLFTDGFSQYHQIKIEKEDLLKKNFAT